jgi:hypothetical protein
MRTVTEALMGRNPTGLVVPLTDVLKACIFPLLSLDDRATLRRLSLSHLRADETFCPPLSLRIRYDALRRSDAGKQMAAILRQLAQVGWDLLPSYWDVDVKIDEGIQLVVRSRFWDIRDGESVNKPQRCYTTARLVVGRKWHAIVVRYHKSKNGGTKMKELVRYDFYPDTNGSKKLHSVICSLPWDYVRRGCEWHQLASAMDAAFPDAKSVY